MKIIDPWGSELPEDYTKIIKDFGLEIFDKDKFPNPNRIMRRGVVFAGRDLNIIADAIKNKKPFYVLSGIMPSGDKIHFGNKLVVEQIKYFQEQGAFAYMLIADLEAAASRGITLEQAKQRAKDFHIPAYIALGLDPKKTIFYYQSENKHVIHLAYEFAKKVTLKEFEAIYGNADPGRIMSAVTQAADIVYPQVCQKVMPGIIPVGIDQDPHIRLTRDLVARTKGTHKFVPPSSIYHKFTNALNGDIKMSKSKPESCIELPEDMASVKKKIMRAMSGGRDTLEEHRKKGAIIQNDMCFELLKQHLIEDDDELQKIHDDYKSGKMLSSEIKQITLERMEKFMNDFTANMDKAKKNIDKLNFVKF